MIAAAVINEGVFDRRSARIFKTLLARSQFKDVAPREVRQLFKQQARLLRENPDRAIEALAVLLPTQDQRCAAVEAVREILMLAPDDLHVERPLVQRLSDVLEMDVRAVIEAADEARKNT